MQQHHIRQALVLLACLVVILVLASGAAGVANADWDRAPELDLPDDFGHPVIMGMVPATFDFDIAAATTAGDDPSIPCPTASQRFKTVWFSYTPTHVGKLHADTYGSGYDTLLAVWTGTRGSLIKVGCSNDAGGTKQSEVNALVMGNTTYYIEVAAFWPNQINTMMHLNVSFTDKYNLLLNPGFELDSNSDGYPANWLYSSLFRRLAWDRAVGGSYVGELLGLPAEYFYTNQAVPVTAGHAYRFLGYVLDGTSSCDGVCAFRMLARWRDGSNTLLGTDTIYTTTSSYYPGEWCEMNKNLIAPPGATTAVIVANVQNLNGLVLIDKFFFVEW